MNRTFSQLNKRSAQILKGIQAGTVSKNCDAIRELAEINDALEDAPIRPEVVARLTVIRKNGLRTIVEVHADAKFYSFYHFYRQVGSKRSTKELIRSSNRNEGSLQQPGLEARLVPH